jgi:hypothetical protein
LTLDDQRNLEALGLLSYLQPLEVLNVKPRQKFKIGHGLKIILTFSE